MSPTIVPEFEGLFIDSSGTERPCVVAGTSLDDLTVAGPGIASGGIALVFRSEGLGLVHGHVEAGQNGALHLRIVEGTARRARLAARLAWYRTRLAGGVDNRAAPRVVPNRTAVRIGWDGTAVEGTLRDVSTGGAGLDVEPRPRIGTQVVVGMRRGIVVRHTDGGVGVRFALPLRPEAVTADIVL